MITLLTVGDDIYSFSEAYRESYQSIFFSSANTLIGYLAIRPHEPFILVLSEITNRGLLYTDILSSLGERGWQKQLPVIVLIDEHTPNHSSEVTYSSSDPYHLNKAIQQVDHTNFSLSKPTEGK